MLLNGAGPLPAYSSILECIESIDRNRSGHRRRQELEAGFIPDLKRAREVVSCFGIRAPSGLVASRDGTTQMEARWFSGVDISLFDSYNVSL